MAKRRWRNIEPLKSPTVVLWQGMTAKEFIDLWESEQLYYLVAHEWMDNLYNEYVLGGTPTE